jgi:predicted TIM-barrel fold metal-dependent hydrolase
VTASGLIDFLNAAGIKRAVVLSTAYGPVAGPSETEVERVRAENDWTAKQIMMFPARLIGFCGINPMRDFALAEIERCSAIPELRYGIKHHFGNSDTDLDDAVKVTRLHSRPQRVPPAIDSLLAFT